MTCFQLAAQSNSKLLHAIKVSRDTSKINALFDYGFWFESYNLDSAAKYYREGGTLAKKLGYTRGRLKYYSNYTYILNQKGDLKNGLKLNLEALDLAQKSGTARDIGDCFFNTGSSYNNIGEFEKALNYYFKAAVKFEEIRDYPSLTLVYDNIGGVYFNSKQFEKGLNYSNKAYELAQHENDKQSMAKILINKSIIENLLHQQKKASDDLQKGLNLSEKIKNTYLQSVAHATFADIHIQRGDFSASRESARKAYAFALEIGSNYAEMEALKVLTASFSASGNVDSTLFYGNRALKFGLKNHFTTDLYKLHEYLAKAYEKKKQYEKALQHFKLFEQQNDSLLLKEVNVKMQRIENDYKSTKAENKIFSLQSSQKRQQSVIVILIAAIILISMFSFLVYNNTKAKRKLVEQEMVNVKKEESLNAAQMALKAQEEERLRIAKDLHDGLGGLLSGIKLTLQSSGLEKPAPHDEKALQQLDKAITEMRRISHSMMPEALSRFGLVDALTDICKSFENNNQFNISYQFFGLTERLSDTIETNLYRIILELLNNAIKHSQADEIYLQVIRDEQLLLITVEDNGVGMDTSTEGFSGMGFRNIESRLKLIQGNMELHSESGQGTTVNIELTL